ncbi:DMT family transporter [Anaeroglobus geminatus]|uniref:Putative membrane protein n=1 Tax=Anaeroglobus geminatus F0357 TaxID=861450 RepID=G9YHQ4_9FIRM|nr:DMT family transporter [Anaeroglobus geminatus]EHM40610.1 putative membrane protein [Anaeroglobus geminatus F0357]
MNRGVIYAVLAALSFSLQNATVKELSVTMGTGEIAFFRGTLSAIIIIVLMKIQDVHFSHEDRPTLILRGIFGGLGMICLFYGLRGVPLADASILSQLSAFFVMLFAAVFLKELIPKGAILPLAVIVCGASLVVRPWHFDAFNVYSLFVLAQAVLAAAAYTTVSRLTASGKHHQYEIVLYFLICAAIAGAVLMGRDFRMPDMTEWGFCIALGIFSVLGQIWITRSYMYGNAVGQLCSVYCRFFQFPLGVRFLRRDHDCHDLNGRPSDYRRLHVSDEVEARQDLSEK